MDVTNEDLKQLALLTTDCRTAQTAWLYLALDDGVLKTPQQAGRIINSRYEGSERTAMRVFYKMMQRKQNAIIKPIETNPDCTADDVYTAVNKLLNLDDDIRKGKVIIEKENDEGDSEPIDISFLLRWKNVEEAADVLCTVLMIAELQTGRALNEDNSTPKETYIQALMHYMKQRGWSFDPNND